MAQLNEALQSNLALVTGGLAVVSLALLLLALLQARRAGRLARRLDDLTRGADGSSVEAVLGAHLESVFAVRRELNELAERTAAVERSERRHLQRLGLVRFNPFEDTGGNLSFALALLDSEDDGLVLTSLHSRHGSRLYGKALRAGRPDAPLSAEEVEAVEMARRAPADRARQAVHARSQAPVDAVPEGVHARRPAPAELPPGVRPQARRVAATRPATSGLDDGTRPLWEDVSRS